MIDVLLSRAVRILLVAPALVLVLMLGNLSSDYVGDVGWRTLWAEYQWLRSEYDCTEEIHELGTRIGAHADSATKARYDSHEVRNACTSSAPEPEPGLWQWFRLE